MRRWFEASFAEPTPAQAMGWPKIVAGANTLICAPTGSGKTLAAFLWGIDRLAREPERLGQGVRIVYVSPLKALSYDIERNLRAPLKGIGAEISVGLRTGDTPQRERQAMRRKPPDILITTPESLYLIMTSGAREILTGAEAVIVDEIHAVAQSKRGAHLALTLERLSHLVATSDPDGRSGGQWCSGRPADRPLGHAAAAGQDRAVPRRPPPQVRGRGRRQAQGARPGDRRPGRGHDRTGCAVASAERAEGGGVRRRTGDADSTR